LVTGLPRQQVPPDSFGRKQRIARETREAWAEHLNASRRISHTTIVRIDSDPDVEGWDKILIRNLVDYRAAAM
jgi:hypothetical protein